MSRKPPQLVKFPDGWFGLMVKPKTAYDDAEFLRLDTDTYATANKPAQVRKFCMATEGECRKKLREFEKPNDLDYEVVS